MDDRLPERFRSKLVSSENGCWIWTGSKDRAGYGRCVLNRRVASALGVSRSQAAHRHCYEILVGPIPEGHDLDHLCRVPACVNPDHLEPVTRSENLRRGKGYGGVLSEGALPQQAKAMAERNRAKTHCPQGHPYDRANTIVQRDGSRKCAECNRARMRVPPRPPRTQCRHGHDITDPANVYMRTSWNGKRYPQCKRCTANQQRAYQQRKRARST